MPPIKTGAFEHIDKWQSVASGSSFNEVRLAAEDELTDALTHMFAMADEHPQLRESGEFKALELTLTAVDVSLRNARRAYNSTVRDYNRRIGAFPGKLLAGLLGLEPKPYFEMACPDDAGGPASKPRPTA